MSPASWEKEDDVAKRGALALTLRAGWRRHGQRWIFLLIAAPALIVPVLLRGTGSLDPLAPLAATHPALLVGLPAWYFAAAWCIGSARARLRASPLIALAPGGALALRRANTRVQGMGAALALVLVGMALLEGLAAVTALASLAATGLAYAGGLTLAQGWQRWSAQAARARTPALLARLEDAYLRLLYRPSRRRHRPNPAWILSVPNHNKMGWFAALPSMSMAPAVYELLQFGGAWGILVMLCWGIAVPPTYSVSGVERLLLLPGGLVRRELPAALRFLHWRTRAPALLGFALMTLVFAWSSVKGADLLHPALSALLAIGMVLAATQLSGAVVTVHPYLVLRPWLSFVGPLGLGALLLLWHGPEHVGRLFAGPAGAWLASPARAAAVLASVLLVTAMMSLVLARAGRRAWEQVDLVPMIQEWQLRARTVAVQNPLLQEQR